MQALITGIEDPVRSLVRAVDELRHTADSARLNGVFFIDGAAASLTPNG